VKKTDLKIVFPNLYFGHRGPAWEGLSLPRGWQCSRAARGLFGGGIGVNVFSSNSLRLLCFLFPLALQLLFSGACLGQGVIIQDDVAMAQAQAAAAKAGQDAAQAQLDTIVGGLTTAYSLSPDYLRAKADVDAAQAAYDAARVKALTAIHGTDAYVKAANDRDAAVAAVDDARSSGDIGAITDAAKAAMKARSAVSKMESDALCADADFQGAKGVLVKASAAAKALDAQFGLSLKQNPQVQKAQRDVQLATAAAEAANGNAVAVQEAHDRREADMAAAAARRYGR
jgi:hypothetical protein